MEEEVKVAVLETKLENFETLVLRLDSAIEKIAEVNNNVSRMLAVHEQRISKQEETPSLPVSETPRRTKCNKVPNPISTPGRGYRLSKVGRR